LKRLKSFTKIKKVYPTQGSYPALVECNNFNDYVCKYSKYTPSQKLYLEFLIANFAQRWELLVPEFALVDVKEDHISDDMATHSTFKPIQPLFGSKYLLDTDDLNKTFQLLIDNNYELNKIKNKEDFLKIGLFDIWIANEDRNHNNFNLLLKAEQEGYYFVAIDHEKAFNSNNLEYGLDLITTDESILSTQICKTLFKNTLNIPSIVDSLVENFYLWVEKCHSDLLDIMHDLPLEWGIGSQKEITLLKKHLFSDNWKKETEKQFRLLIQQNLMQS